jgi:hypothetical protein
MEILAVLAPDGADPVRAETRRSFAILDQRVPPTVPLGKPVLPMGNCVNCQPPRAVGRASLQMREAITRSLLLGWTRTCELRRRSCTHAPVSCAEGPALMPVRPEDHSGGNLGSTGRRTSHYDNGYLDGKQSASVPPRSWSACARQREPTWGIEKATARPASEAAHALADTSAPLLPVAGVVPLESSSGPRPVPCRRSRSRSRSRTMTTLPVT